MGEGRPKVSHAPNLSLEIAGNEDISRLFTKFEWKSFLNGGYIIKASVYDPYWQGLRSIIEDYLKTARKEPTELKWSIEWATTDRKTEERTAILTDLYIPQGSQNGGNLEFVAIDPPSFFLNAGNCDGSSFEGKVSDVIRQVVNRYAPDISLDISETKDHDKNRFWMMRQDPKTFIMSMLDWSASITNDKTNWIVASSDNELIIKEQSEFDGEDFGIFSVNADSPSMNDVLEFDYLADSFITTLQTKLITQGISSTTEKYLDKKVDEDERFVFVKDENTSNKRNTGIGSDRGFTKPKDSLNFDDGQSASGGTSVIAIPELSGSELGIPYEQFIDGRARNRFLRMLSMVSRLKIRVNGNSDLDDSTKLGVSTCTLQWFDAEQMNFFLGGKWLIYGWHHVVSRNHWYTDMYLTRLDHDSSARSL